MTSTLPEQPAAAAQAAVDAAIQHTGTAAAEEPSSSPATPTTDTANAATANGSHPDDSTDADDADASIRTVFDDKEDFNVKHPLYNLWTLWFDNPSHKSASAGKGSKDSWGEDLNKVVSFDSVEEFWGLYNNIIPPSELPQKANYYLFKDGIKPAWEDPANANGGKWSIQLPRDKSRASIDQLWLFTMLSAIGETLEKPITPQSGAAELITGVIMSARANFYRIAIWTRKSDDPASTGNPTEAADVMDRLMSIGKKFKTEILGFQIDQKLGSGLMSDVEYQSHTESEKKKGRKIVL
ncbi:unnamed protein product [Parajaminaea phylloscopi]